MSIDYSDYEVEDVDIKAEQSENEEENVMLQFQDEDDELFDEELIKKEAKPKN